MARIPFRPKWGPLDAQLRHVQLQLARYGLGGDGADSGAGLNDTLTDSGDAPTDSGGGTDPPSTTIPEADVEWDPVGGHYHDGTISRAIELHGDTTGFNTASVVAQIQTRPVPLPGTPEDGKYPKYDDATQALIWSVPVSTGTQCQLAGWYDPDISLRSTSMAELYQADSTQVQLGEGMLADGAVVGIGLFASGDVGAAVTDGIHAELYIDGIATGWVTEITGAAGTEHVGINISFQEPFLRTQVLTIYAKRLGTPNPVKVRAFLLVQLAGGGGGSTTPGNAPSDALYITATANAVLTNEILTSAVIGKGSLAGRAATSPYGGFLWMVDDSAGDTPRWSRYNGSGWDDFDPASYGAAHLCVLRAGDTMSGKLALSITASGASGDQETASFQHGDAAANPYVTVGTTAGDAGVFLLYNKTSAQGRVGKHGGSGYAFEWGASGAVIHNAGATVTPGAPFHLRFSGAGGSVATTQRLSTHLATSNPASGWGSVEKWQLSTDDGAGGVGTTRDAADLTVLWATALDGSRKARATWGVYDTAVRECLRLEASGAAAMIGFLGASAVVRPSATTDLRLALINLGLYTTGGASPLNLNGGALSAGTGAFSGTVTLTPGTTTTKGWVINAPASYATNWFEGNDSGGDQVFALNQNTQLTLNPPKAGTGTGFAALKLFAYGTPSNLVVIDCFASAGDRTTPTAVASNSTIASWRAFAHNGTSQPVGGTIAFKAAELQAVGSAGTDIVFSVCKNTTASIADVLKIKDDGSLRWGASFDAALYRDTTNTFGVRNGAAACAWRVYNTADAGGADPTNYERGFLRWTGNVFEIGTAAAGTGTARGLRVAAASTDKLAFWGGTPAARPTAFTQNFTTASHTVNAYTSNSQGSAYTGIASGTAGTPYAQLTDLNALRTAYETLRASYDNLLQVVTALIDDDQSVGFRG